MRIWTDDEYIEVEPNDVGQLEAAMLFKAEHIKAKADPGLFVAVANMLSRLWDSATKRVDDGCGYCKEDNEGFRRMFGAFSLENPFHGKTWKICAGKCKPMEIYFCPMCGRRLPHPPKGEEHNE